ncbi:MAG TPA: peptidylprolyl isomerase [Phycisphaerae bacterium]|nr:peptidylprolyl isomerase [Phycisphaerae bacterium]
MKNLVGGSMERLRAKCRREGTTLDDLLKMQRRELTVQIYLQSKFMPAIVITRRMLWNFYRDHQDLYHTDKKVQMQIIAAPFDQFLPENVTQPTSEEKQIASLAARRHIENAYRMLLSGSDFDKIAMEMSKGPMAAKNGIWPAMTKGNFREAAVEQAAFELPTGRFSSIIEGDNGYYIVRARKVYPGKKISFEQAQEGVENSADPSRQIAPIEEILRRDQFAKLRTEYMANVYKQATIVIPDNFYYETLRQAMLRYRPGAKLQN